MDIFKTVLLEVSTLVGMVVIAAILVFIIFYCVTYLINKFKQVWDRKNFDMAKVDVELFRLQERVALLEHIVRNLEEQKESE